MSSCYCHLYWATLSLRCGIKVLLGPDWSDRCVPVIVLVLLTKMRGGGDNDWLIIRFLIDIRPGDWGIQLESMSIRVD